MIKAGEKLGMKMEARIRKCRLYNGQYYDSIKMGLLREEWELLRRSGLQAKSSIPKVDLKEDDREGSQANCTYEN